MSSPACGDTAGGQFKITVDGGRETDWIAHNASASEINQALAAIGSPMICGELFEELGRRPAKPPRSRWPKAALAWPVTPATARPKRNRPCPCGSGRKYKICCGRSHR